MSAAPQAVAVSLILQRLASEIDGALGHAAGEPTAFVLIINTAGVMQYVSNAARADGVEMIEGLLARWQSGGADIPAHYNPDLKR